MYRKRYIYQWGKLIICVHKSYYKIIVFNILGKSYLINEAGFVGYLTKFETEKQIYSTYKYKNKYIKLQKYYTPGKWEN